MCSYFMGFSVVNTAQILIYKNTQSFKFIDIEKLTQCYCTNLSCSSIGIKAIKKKNNKNIKYEKTI